MLLQNHVPRPRVAGCGLVGALGIDAPIRTRVALGSRDCGRVIRLDSGGLAAAPATRRVRPSRVATDRKFVTIYDLARPINQNAGNEADLLFKTTHLIFKWRF